MFSFSGGSATIEGSGMDKLSVTASRVSLAAVAVKARILSPSGKVLCSSPNCAKLTLKS